MAVEKRNSPSKTEKPEQAPQITPMPFPGESPTVALAMAAGEKFGYHEEEKPVKAKAAPKRKAAAKKKVAKPARKAKAAKPAKPKAKATKPARAKKGR